MVASEKYIAKTVNSVPKTTPKAPVKTAGSTKNAKHSEQEEDGLRSYYSNDSQAKVQPLLLVIEEAPGRDGHGDDLVGLVAELTEAGMNYYFLRSAIGTARFRCSAIRTPSHVGRVTTHQFNKPKIHRAPGQRSDFGRCLAYSDARQITPAKTYW